MKFCVTAPSLPVTKPLNVEDVMEVNAAITSNENSQQNNVKNLRPFLPMYFSMIKPMDLPSFFTEAYKAEKSCTAPKKIPPINSQRSAGTQPNTAARIGPCTGPAPAMDENW